MKYFVGLLVCLLAWSYAQPVRVAAAANLRHVLPDIIEAFEKTHPEVTIDTSFGSSGNIYHQLQQGAPYDLFISADDHYTQQLDAAGLSEPGTRVHYATGRLALWFHQRLGFDPDTLAPELLADARVTRVALANPEHAPYGQAALHYLHTQGFYPALEDKLVYGDNISQAAQLALHSGGAGLLALSLALHPSLADHGDYYLLPAASHPPLIQEMLIVRERNTPPVKAFYRFLLTPEAQTFLQQYGFEVP